MSSEHSAPTTDLCRMAVLLIVDLALNSLFFADFYSLRARINCWEHDTLLKDLTTKNFSRSTIKEPTQPHSRLELILSGHFLGSKMKVQKSSLKSHLSNCKSFRSRGCLESPKFDVDDLKLNLFLFFALMETFE